MSILMCINVNNNLSVVFIINNVSNGNVMLMCN